MPSAIDPSAIPGKDIDPDAIEVNATTVGTIAGHVRDSASNVHLKWQAMAGVYVAPESDTLLGLMQPVSSQATAVGDNLDVVSAALIQFAADVRPIKAELESLREQATAFRESIDGGVQVREINPAWTSAQGVSGSWNAYGAASSSTTDVPQYRYVEKEWHEVQEHVDRNNELIAAVNAQQMLLWEAERTCANKIRGLYGAAPLRAAQSEDDALGYGIEQIPEGTEMPWGAEVERTEGCGEATANFVFKDFLWEGVVVGGIWGTVTGLGTLVLGYNPETGDFFSGDAYGAAWGNLAQIVFSGAATAGILAPLFLSDTIAQQFGGGFLPQELRDFKAQADETALNTGKALIAWDKWADDPGTALGETVFNVGTILIPAGAAITGVKTAGTAANVLSRMAKVADFVDPAAWAVNGAMRLGSAGLGSLDNLISRLDLKAVDINVNVGDLPVSFADDALSGLRALDNQGVDLSQVFARVDDGVPVFEYPGGRVEMPAGAFDHLPGARPDGGADVGITAPVRETELVNVGGGGVRGETGTSPGNSIVDDAPARPETGGSGETMHLREPETQTGGNGSGETGSGSAGRGEDGTGANGSGENGSGTGDGGGAKDGSGGDGTSGRGDDGRGNDGKGDGWEKGPDRKGSPIDPDYGKPLAEHGTLDDKYTPPPPDEIPADVRHLVTDPDAPYGRAEDNHAYSRAEWEERYVGPDNRPIYPGNDGAAPGSFVEYTDMAAFQRDYGAALDRMGGEAGAYLSPEGVPFEARSLPGSNLNAGYHVYRLTEELPPGVRIEVSEVAPAFGRDGGGIQIRVLDADGNPLSVQQMMSDDYRILTEPPRDPGAASIANDAPVRPDGDGSANMDSLSSMHDHSPNGPGTMVSLEQRVDSLNGSSPVFDTTGRDIASVINQSSLSADELAAYLFSKDPNSFAEFARTGEWPSDVQIPKSIDSLVVDVLDNLVADWDQVPQRGYVIDDHGNAVKQPISPPVGSILDRYGPPTGTFTSPVSSSGPFAYDQRSLPFVEDPGQYHQYEVIQDLSNLKPLYDAAPDRVRVAIDNAIDRGYFTWGKLTMEGEIAPGFNSRGGGTQWELPLPVNILKLLGALKEV